MASLYTRKVLNLRILPQSPGLPPSRPRANFPDDSRAFPNVSELLQAFAFALANTRVSIQQISELCYILSRKIAAQHFLSRASPNTRNRSRTSRIPAFYPFLIHVILLPSYVPQHSRFSYIVFRKYLDTPFSFEIFHIVPSFIFSPFPFLEIRGHTRFLLNYFLFL